MFEVAESVWHITHLELTFRICLSMILGGVIGLERELNNHAAGLRTHILVCIGSATIMLLSIHGFNQFVNELNVRVDPARLAAQVISGIGFLGAGAIMRTGSFVSGLTTAASIWVIASIGLSVGAGFYYPAVLATTLVWICLFVLNKWEKHMMLHRRTQEIRVKIVDRPGILGQIAAELSSFGIQIKNVQMTQTDDSPQKDGTLLAIELNMRLRSSSIDLLTIAMDKVAAMPEIYEIEMIKPIVVEGKPFKPFGLDG
ncbi:MgtC/SapB family protein [Paenibacillus piri]|uniref:MgtC/SapB family protein n=1 Tax=Paenibacillus piri TaxID=2547395 RepID=A0A4R5KSF4_9BACL|nr:MgtC/SapB family protein [Paenibacillus piri]TDF97968.1 MgtC/SapB family protein [Paenibacillus piri]